MNKPLIALLFVFGLFNASFAATSFTKTYNTVWIEFDNDDDSLNNTENPGINSFIFNVNNSTNILYIKADGSSELLINAKMIDTAYVLKDSETVQMVKIFHEDGTEGYLQIGNTSDFVKLLFDDGYLQFFNKPQ